MPMQVVFAANEECAAELEKMGFTREEVWTKWCSSVRDGEAEIFGMKKKPCQFAATDFWGAKPN